MALTIDDLNLKTSLPRLPRSVPLFEAASPTLDERRRAVDVFAETFDLGDLKPVELPHSIAFASRGGEVEFFPASGAIWARDGRAEEAHDNELRKWPDLEEVQRDDDVVFELGRGDADAVVGQARELLGAAELADDHRKLDGVVLDQVSQLSEKGEILRRGAGAATVVFRYELAGLPVLGAGAKSHVYAQPDGRGARVTGGFHCWRPIVADRALALSPVEDALKVGVLQDPELARHHEAGGRIEIDRLRLGYMALPAMVQQRHLFPVFELAGRVHTPDSKQEFFEFARYHHAVAPERYAEVGAFAGYLATAN